MCLSTRSWGHLGTSRGADTDCATARLRCGLTTDFLRSDIFSALKCSSEDFTGFHSRCRWSWSPALVPKNSNSLLGLLGLGRRVSSSLPILSFPRSLPRALSLSTPMRWSVWGDGVPDQDDFCPGKRLRKGERAGCEIGGSFLWKWDNRCSC